MLAAATVFADLLYPPACWACGASIPRQPDGFCAACPVLPVGGRCRRCAEPLGPAADPPDCGNCRGRAIRYGRVLALGRYEGALKEAIRRAKYTGSPGALRWLGGRLGAEAAAESIRRDAVVPVPSSRTALRTRGFNPARLLAEPVARALGVRCEAWLERPGKPPAQVGLGRKERLANARGAFRCARGASPAGARILLVDDVMTTGATADACAEALIAAGALTVDVAVAAR